MIWIHRVEYWRELAGIGLNVLRGCVRTGKTEMLLPWSPSWRFPVRGQGSRDKEMGKQVITAMVYVVGDKR